MQKLSKMNQMKETPPAVLNIICGELFTKSGYNLLAGLLNKPVQSNDQSVDNRNKRQQ